MVVRARCCLIASWSFQPAAARCAAAYWVRVWQWWVVKHNKPSPILYVSRTTEWLLPCSMHGERCHALAKSALNASWSWLTVSCCQLPDLIHHASIHARSTTAPVPPLTRAVASLHARSASAVVLLRLGAIITLAAGAVTAIDTSSARRPVHCVVVAAIAAAVCNGCYRLRCSIQKGAYGTCCTIHCCLHAHRHAELFSAQVLLC